MHKLFIFCFVALFALSSHVAIANNYGGVREDHPYNFVISKDVYFTSKIFQINSPQKETYPGSVKKSAFRIRANYDLSNQAGWQATGITRIVSLGALYPWAQDIDIYDTRGVQIGMIDGELATLESAKFTLYEYDESGNHTKVGVAYADSSFNRFSILASSGNPHAIAELNRNFSNNTWDVSVHYPEKLDDRIIRIFASFVIDYQDKFLSTKKTKTEKNSA